MRRRPILALFAAVLLAPAAGAQVYQTGDDLPFAAHFVASKVGATGLTVTVDCDRAGTSVVTGASAVEERDGYYSYSLTGGTYVTTAGHYVCVFKTTDGTVDQQQIADAIRIAPANANLDAAISTRSDFDELLDPVELLDSGGSAGTSAAEAVVDVWAATTRTLTSNASVTITGPVATTGAISIVQGDSYLTADGRQLSWSPSSGDFSPDPTGVTSLSFSASSPNGETFTATPTASAANTIVLQLTSAQTATLAARVWSYVVTGTTGTETYTYVRGDRLMTVLESY